MRPIFKKPWFYILSFIALVVVGGIAFAALTPDVPEYDTAIVQLMDLKEEVAVTGKVEPAQEVELSFATSGKVATSDVNVGDRVQEGQMLASLTSSQISAQLASAQASVASARSTYNEYERSLSVEQAKLDELRLGSRPEEVTLAQTKLDNARRALADAARNVDVVKAKADQDLASIYAKAGDVLTEAYNKADDAVYKYADAMFYKYGGAKNELVFLVDDPVIKQTAQDSRADAQNAVDRFAGMLISLPADEVGIDSALRKGINEVSSVQTFLLQLNTALNNSVGVEAEALANYKESVSTARANANAASTAINNHIQSIASQRVLNDQNINTASDAVNSAENAVQVAQAELTLKLAGTLPDQIRAQEARVDQAKTVLATQSARVSQALADVQRLYAESADYIIRAPFDGLITRQDVKRGEIVAAHTPMITMIAAAAFEIKANVPEADIAKIALEDTADLTLDAYGDDDHFAAHVVAIDPAQTVIEGVSTYKVTFQFKQEDERVKQGMTANIIVVTDERTQVLAIPQRAVISRNGSRIVRRLTSARQVEEVLVETGLLSSDGQIEVIRGVSAGDEIIIAERER